MQLRGVFRHLGIAERKIADLIFVFNQLLDFFRPTPLLLVLIGLTHYTNGVTFFQLLFLSPSARFDCFNYGCLICLIETAHLDSIKVGFFALILLSIAEGLSYIKLFLLGRHLFPLLLH